MASSLVLPVDDIRDRLNQDREFILTARFWYCDLRFVIGDDRYFIPRGWLGRVDDVPGTAGGGGLRVERCA